MNARTVAVLSAVAAFAAAPAFAQGAGNMPSNGSQDHASNIGMTLKQDLTKAGFTDVQVSPEAYVVHAKDSHGEPVVMRIGPDSVTEITEVAKNTNTAQNTTHNAGPSTTAGTGSSK